MKQKIKIIIDIIMTALLLMPMGYQLWGEIAHESAGIAILFLFIAHHILNINWHKNLFKGKYSAVRTAILAVDILVLITMLLQMYSGIVLSKHIFAFLPISGGMALARKLHILGSYWGFILMSAHIGMHWNRIIGMLIEKTKQKKLSKLYKAMPFAAGCFISAYGIIAFLKRDIITYLFLKNEFVFMDFDESKILFYFDYIAIMGLIIFISYYMFKCLKKKKLKR